MTMFGDMTDEDAFDTAPLDLDAVGRLFVGLLRLHFDAGHRRQALIGLAFIALVARLQREGAI
jgi:hypothetical protein